MPHLRNSVEPKIKLLTQLQTQQNILPSTVNRVLQSPPVHTHLKFLDLVLEAIPCVSGFTFLLRHKVNLNDVIKMLSWCVLIRKDKLALRARTWYSFLLGSSSLRTATASTVGRRAGIFVNMSTKANTTTRGGTPHGARALAAKTSGRKHAAKAVPVSHYGSNSLEETRSEVCGGTQKKKSLSGAAV